MLSFFTDPYPDELLYSVFARYHFYSGNIDLKDTLIELFGKNTVIPSLELGSYLSYLCNRLSGVYTPKSLIQKHSLFPFYAPFLPIKRRNELIQDLIWNDGQGIYTKLGLAAGSIGKRNTIFYCSICAQEDIKRFGEPYIHREHQLQGVVVCPHHGCYLREYIIRHKERSRIEYVRLNEEMLELSEVYLCREAHCERLWQIAKAAYYLLTHDFVSIDKWDILQRYKDLLYERNLITKKLSVRQDELYDLLVSYYGAAFLTLLESSIDQADEYSWLKIATRNEERTVHPLRHILLILWLVGDMDTFFSGVGQLYHPFRRGPWPCLNRAAEHYYQDVVNEVIITADSKTRKPVGTFNCSCGYSYSRTGPDQSESDRYRKGRVKVFGHVWENRLRELVDPRNLSYRKIAFYMGCDVKTVQKFESIVINPPVDVPIMPEEQAVKHVERLINYKNELIQRMIKCPELSRTDLRGLCQKEYTFLYRHDKDWLFSMLPPAKKPNGSKGYINWQQRDHDILQQLKKAKGELLNQKKSVRISCSSLGKKIGQIALLEKYIEKLPKCRKFLNEVIETTQQFQIRRCQQVIWEMQNEGLPLVEWKIWRKAGLRHEAYRLIKDKLDWDSYLRHRGE